MKQTEEQIRKEHGEYGVWESRPWSVGKVGYMAGHEWWMFKIRAGLEWHWFCDHIRFLVHCKRGYHKIRGINSITKHGKRKISTRWRECVICKSMFFISAREKTIYLKFKEGDREMMKSIVQRHKGGKSDDE